MIMGQSKAEKDAIASVRAQRPPERLISWRRRICPECGKEFIVREGPGAHQQFCTAQHRDKFKSRCAARGKVVVPYLLMWRKSRGARGSRGAAAYRELCRIVDAFASEDKDAGRPSMDDYIGAILDSGFTYADRTRK